MLGKKLEELVVEGKDEALQEVEKAIGKKEGVGVGKGEYGGIISIVEEAGDSIDKVIQKKRKTGLVKGSKQRRKKKLAKEASKLLNQALEVMRKEGKRDRFKFPEVMEDLAQEVVLEVLTMEAKTARDKQLKLEAAKLVLERNYGKPTTEIELNAKFQIEGIVVRDLTEKSFSGVDIEDAVFEELKEAGRDEEEKMFEEIEKEVRKGGVEDVENDINKPKGEGNGRENI